MCLLFFFISEYIFFFWTKCACPYQPLHSHYNFSVAMAKKSRLHRKVVLVVDNHDTTEPVMWCLRLITAPRYLIQHYLDSGIFGFSNDENHTITIPDYTMEGLTNLEMKDIVDQTCSKDEQFRQVGAAQMWLKGQLANQHNLLTDYIKHRKWMCIVGTIVIQNM